MSPTARTNFADYIGLALSGMTAIAVVIFTESNVGTVAAIYLLQLFIAGVAFGLNDIRVRYRLHKQQVSSFTAKNHSAVKQAENSLMIDIVVIWSIVVLFLFFLSIFAFPIISDDGSSAIFVGDIAPDWSSAIVASIPFVLYYLVFLQRQPSSQITTTTKKMLTRFAVLFIGFIPLAVLLLLEDYIERGSTQLPLLYFMMIKIMTDLYSKYLENTVSAQKR